jgi:hypothetical protein
VSGPKETRDQLPHDRVFRLHADFASGVTLIATAQGDVNDTPDVKRFWNWSGLTIVDLRHVHRRRVLKWDIQLWSQPARHRHFSWHKDTFQCAHQW